MLVKVECVREFDPPMIRVTIAGQAAFEVSSAVYEILREQLGWPDNPCGGIGS